MSVTEGTGPETAGNYREPYRVYAGRYGCAVRTLKRWVAAGRAVGDPPPLDDPAGMVAWWSSHMTHRVPDEFWAAANQDAPELVEPVELVAVEAVEELPPVTGGRGLEAELEGLERLAARLRAGAHLPGQQKGYLDTVARMTATSEKLRSEAERAKRLLPRDLVESAIHEFHGPIEREVRLLYRTMCEVMGLPASPEREALWTAEVDRLFARMGEEIFKLP